MTILVAEPQDQSARLERARDAIATRAPELSAETLLSKAQRRGLIALLVIVAAGFALSWRLTAIVLIALAIVAYSIAVVQRIVLTHRSLKHSAVVAISDAEARALADDELPVYTVLVPMYHEAAVVADLVEHLRAIEYPRHLLEVLLLVEEDDADTFAAVLAHAGDEFSVIVVPAGSPQTKPRALNYGLTFATGEFVTIFDAEDRPDPLQLRRAVVAFGRAPGDVACMQAQLAFWNVDQNLLTRLFEIEYRQCFELVLPALSATDAPMPLGGTSNHIRRGALDDVGAWDPHNVTEDADLGVRLRRAGYRSLVLGSTTLEEANSDYVNWNKQRSRWYKGYLQTWLVHMRRPFRLIDEVGWRGFFDFNVFVAGTPMLSLLNLVFWTTTLAWFVGHFHAIESVFPAPVYYPALACFVFGNFAMAYLFVLAARTTGRPSLVWSACLVPLYWLAMAIAAVKAHYQLVADRSFWEKTVHGLSPAEQPATDVPVIDLTADEPVDGPSPLVSVTPVAPAAVADPEIEYWIDSESRAGVSAPQARVRRVLRRTSIAVGAFLVLLVTYVAVLSGPLTRSVSHRVVTTVPVAPKSGTCVAQLYVERTGYRSTICEGTATKVLAHGLGHLRGTPLPGQAGEAVVVGHNDAFGGTGAAIAQLRAGDTVLVHIAGVTVDYRVISRATESRGSVRFADDSHARLMLVTGASAIDLGRVVVVRAAAASLPTIHFVGTALADRGTPHLPGGDGGELLLGLACACFAVVAWAQRKRVAQLPSAQWAVPALTAIAVASVFAAIVITTRALPPTF